MKFNVFMVILLFYSIFCKIDFTYSLSPGSQLSQEKFYFLSSDSNTFSPHSYLTFKEHLRVNDNPYVSSKSLIQKMLDESLFFLEDCQFQNLLLERSKEIIEKFQSNSLQGHKILVIGTGPIGAAAAVKSIQEGFYVEAVEKRSRKVRTQILRTELALSEGSPLRKLFGLPLCQYLILKGVFFSGFEDSADPTILGPSRQMFTQVSISVLENLLQTLLYKVQDLFPSVYFLEKETEFIEIQSEGVVFKNKDGFFMKSDRFFMILNASGRVDEEEREIIGECEAGFVFSMPFVFKNFEGIYEKRGSNVWLNNENAFVIKSYARQPFTFFPHSQEISVQQLLRERGTGEIYCKRHLGYFEYNDIRIISPLEFPPSIAFTREWMGILDVPLKMRHFIHKFHRELDFPPYEIDYGSVGGPYTTSSFTAINPFEREDSSYTDAFYNKLPSYMNRKPGSLYGFDFWFDRSSLVSRKNYEELLDSLVQDWTFDSYQNIRDYSFDFYSFMTHSFYRILSAVASTSGEQSVHRCLDFANTLHYILTYRSGNYGDSGVSMDYNDRYQMKILPIHQARIDYFKKNSLYQLRPCVQEIIDRIEDQVLSNSFSFFLTLDIQHGILGQEKLSLDEKAFVDRYVDSIRSTQAFLFLVLLHYNYRFLQPRDTFLTSLVGHYYSFRPIFTHFPSDLMSQFQDVEYDISATDISPLTANFIEREVYKLVTLTHQRFSQEVLNFSGVDLRKTLVWRLFQTEDRFFFSGEVPDSVLERRELLVPWLRLLLLNAFPKNLVDFIMERLEEEDRMPGLEFYHFPVRIERSRNVLENKYGQFVMPIGDALLKADFRTGSSVNTGFDILETHIRLLHEFKRDGFEWSSVLQKREELQGILDIHTQSVMEKVRLTYLLKRDFREDSLFPSLDEGDVLMDCTEDFDLTFNNSLSFSSFSSEFMVVIEGCA